MKRKALIILLAVMTIGLVGCNKQKSTPVKVTSHYTTGNFHDLIDWDTNDYRNIQLSDTTAIQKELREEGEQAGNFALCLELELRTVRYRLAVDSLMMETLAAGLSEKASADLRREYHTFYGYLHDAYQMYHDARQTDEQDQQNDLNAVCDLEQLIRQHTQKYINLYNERQKQ